MAIMDDLRISLNVREVSCTAPRVLDASISQIAMELTPGYSRGLRAKLPPSAPATKHPRKPSILRYWEGNGEVKGFAIRFTAPVARQLSEASTRLTGMSLPQSVSEAFKPKTSQLNSTEASENGVFARFESVEVTAYGKAADERHEAMAHAAINVRGCSAGSIAVDALSVQVYEATAAHGDMSSEVETSRASEHVESAEGIDKIVATRPEALLWIEDVSAALDINCSKRHSMRVDIASNGGVVAIEPLGLVTLVQDLASFASSYISPHPTRPRWITSTDTESTTSLARTSSGSSLQSSDDESTSFRLVSDLRHWTAVVLGHGPIGDSDTMAIVLSCQSIAVPQLDFFGGTSVRIHGVVNNVELQHWSQWARTTNLVCREAMFDIHPSAGQNKAISLKDTCINWDLDVQSGLESLPGLFASLKKLKSLAGMLRISPDYDRDDIAVTMPQTLSRMDLERVHVPESDRRERRKRKHQKLMNALSKWEVNATNISITASFPDGPNIGITAGELPVFCLGAETYVGLHVVLKMQDRKCIYGSELRLDSPLHTMNRNIEKRRLGIEIHGLRLMLLHDFQFGQVLQDWLLRFRTVLKVSREARLRRRGIPIDKIRRRPLFDIRFTAKDVEVYIEDHPLGGFLTRMLPLFQDETRERLVREQLMAVRIQQLERIARAKISGTAQRCVDALKKNDSQIWQDRVRKLKDSTPAKCIANGHLPPLEFAPLATFVAASLSFDITMDDAVREQGSIESIRRLKMLDDYELGLKKHNKTRQHDSDAWNSIGFRAVQFDASGVRLRFRDYPVAFVVIDRMYFDKTVIGQAVQATVPPYVAETTVAIGRRRLVKIVKGLGSTKTFADIHLIIDTLQCGYNPSFLGAIGDFGRGVSRFFAGGKNPSPRIPWFDSLRVNMHGRMRLTAKKLKGHLTSSVSPYSMTKHFVDIDADNFEMLTSRLEATTEDPFPISWKMENWHLRPSSFDKNFRSKLVFDFVRVGLKPTISVLGGDSQDHYFIPFPSREDVSQGGPGIGKGSATLLFANDPVQVAPNGFGGFTTWMTGLHEIPGVDSFKDYKTHTMILGVDLCITHSKCDKSPFDEMESCRAESGNLFGSFSEPGSSVLHSDAVSTLIKVVKKFVRRPISCRLAPRRAAKMRRPPSPTGLSSTLVGLDFTIDAKNLKLALYNNLEPGHGLFLSVSTLTGELRKRTKIQRLEGRNVKRTSKLTKRRLQVVDIYSSIRVPGLDMAVDSDDTGKLLTVDKVWLSDDLAMGPNCGSSSMSKGTGHLNSPTRNCPVSGFGSDDLEYSPFYTFSATHPFQRGTRLDKQLHDKQLRVDRVRLIWSPVRRVSMSAWPDAFKEKSFAMKAPKVDFTQETSVEPAKTSPFAKVEAGEEEQGGSRKLSDGDHISDLDISDPSPFTSDSMIHTKQKTARDVRRSRTSNEYAYLASELSSPSTQRYDADPLSPPLLSIPRSRIPAWRRPMGTMIDLLSPRDSDSSGSRSRLNDCNINGLACGSVEVLKTAPKVVLHINDCQVAFGSPETSGIVFLTSRAVRVGIIDKELRKNMQLGETNEEWSSREYRVHLNEANIFSRSASSGEFDFSGKQWVDLMRSKADSLALVTRRPISMDLMYISSSSTPRKNDEGHGDDHILRPSLLYINIPDITMSTNADEFHAVADVIRKVLMQSMRYSEVVNEELSKLRFKLQLAGGKVSSEELDDIMRTLNNVTKQFLYAGDTFQQHLVENLILPGEKSFSDTLLRYKAKAKAVATFMRQDQKASSTDIQYPTMYVSYSFDKCSWELRETYKEMHRVTEHPFVELTLEDLVCRHIFYIGRGSSAEMTFGNISAQNKIKSNYFEGIREPAAAGVDQKNSRIKASDGSRVAFRWYSTQEDRVGGIPVYNLLTIQVAPMNASLTRKLWTSVSAFIFSARSKPGPDDDNAIDAKSPAFSRTLSRSNMSSPNLSTATDTSSGVIPLVTKVPSKMDDVSQMARRGESSMLFKYIFIDAFELTASYKNKENPTRGVLDFSNLFVTTPSFSYSSQLWTWKAFSTQIRKDLVMTFARRGVSNLAKIKLLPGYPGYARARRKLMQSAGSVKETLQNLVPLTSMTAQASSQGQADVQEEDVPDPEVVQGNKDATQGISNGDHSSSGFEEDEEEERQERIDAAVEDISTNRQLREQAVLKVLYGEQQTPGTNVRDGRKSKNGSRSMTGSESSGESMSYRRSREHTPPLPIPTTTGENGTMSSTYRSSRDEEGLVWPQAPKVSLFSRFRRRANDVTTTLLSELDEYRND